MSEDLQEPPAPAPAEDQKLIKLGEQMDRIGVDGAGRAMAHTFKDQVAVAAYAFRSRLLPESIKSTEQAWMVMQRGAELGFPGLTAFEFLYPVNGKVRLTPDGAKAKALQSGLLEDWREEIVGEGEAMLARVTIKRRGVPTPIVSEFSVEDARQAGLWGKSGSAWAKYPKRMLLARARGFGFGDAFRDVVGGLQVREQFDLDPGEAVSTIPAGRVAAQPAPAPAGADPLLGDLQVTLDAEIVTPAKKPAPVLEPQPKCDGEHEHPVCADLDCWLNQVLEAEHDEPDHVPEPKSSFCKSDHAPARNWLSKKIHAKSRVACDDCTAVCWLENGALKSEEPPA